MRRREFLQRGAFAGAGVLSTGVFAASAATTAFTLGVASGDPTADSVVIWTRLAPNPLNGGGMPDWPFLVQWRVANDESMLSIVQEGTAIAWPGLAHAVHVEVTNLSPGRWYFYQFYIGADRSRIGRTRTMPARATMPDAFRFAFVSCQDWQNGFYAAYRNLAQEDLDLVIHLGDYIYESAARATAVRQHNGAEPNSLASYRNRHALYKTDPHLQAAHAAFPWFVVPDDHEVDNNYAAHLSEDNVDPAVFLQRRANAFRAYYEHMPVRPASFPLGPYARLYRSIAAGDLVQFTALDTRQFRSDQPCGDGLQLPCAQRTAPTQTMTGAAQEQWLFGQLDASSARWNVIAQQTMFAQYDFLAGSGEAFLMDQWDGYVAARRRITDFLLLRQPSNPIVISGDLHSNWVHDLKADFDNPSSANVGVEFVGTSISSDFPAEANPFVAAAQGDNPHTRFFDGRYRGYVRCTVTPGAWLSDFRAVPSILTADVDAFTLASFVVVNGQPVALRSA